MVIRKILYIAIVAIASTLCLSGCYHGVHEFGPSEYAGKNSVGYMTTSLQWADTADAGTRIQNFYLVFSGSGNSFSRLYPSDEAASKQFQQLPTGDYDLLVTINMTPAEGYDFWGIPTPQTKAGSGLGDISVSLEDSTHTPKQSWYGIGNVSIKENSIDNVDIKLQRLLPVLKLYMTNMPAGASVSFTFNDLAKEIKLTSSGNSKYGVAGNEGYAKITVDEVKTGPDGILNADYVLLPTVAGLERCEATMIITTAAGATCYNINMPCIECSKTYNLALDYNNLKSENYINSSSINDWEDGWSVSGEAVRTTGIPMLISPFVEAVGTRASMGTDSLKDFYFQVSCTDTLYSCFEHITKKSGSWSATDTIYWKDKKTPITYCAACFGNHAFTKAEFKNGVDLTLPSDQSTQAKLNSADLLTLKATQTKYEDTDHGKLPVALSHGLAKINFVLSLDAVFYNNDIGLTSNPVSDFMVVGSNAGFNFRPQTGAVSVKSGTQASIIPMETAYTPGTATAKTAKVIYEAIVVPQIISAGVLNVSFMIGSKSYEWSNTVAIVLESGKNYNLPLSAE